MKKSLGIKTIVYPTPVLIVGTYDREGVPNAMAVAWGGICCSEPAAIAISVRKARQTYDNLMNRNAFTVNIPSESYVKEADYFGIVSGKKEHKFEMSGLTPVKSDLVAAPYISEFPMVIECVVSKSIELGSHTQFIGVVKDVKVEESMLRADGVPDMSKIKPISFNPADRGYYGIGRYVAEAYSIGKRT